jgi:hypothetical protein
VALIPVALISTMLLLLVPTLSYASTTDRNGIEYLQPSGYDLEYGTEHFSFVKNFRSDGSMRMDFEGTNIAFPSLFIAGYFNVELGGGSERDCRADPREEISIKVNGGPHNDDDPEYADTMDAGVIKFNADSPSRFRVEPEHPDYSSSYSSRALPSGGWPIQVSDICSVPGGFIGAALFKLVLDNNDDGTADAVRIISLVDESGLQNNRPQNNWEIVYTREFSIPNGMDGIKSMEIPYVCLPEVDECDEAQQTIRIDEQSRTAWRSISNPPYKFVTLKEIETVN